MQITWDIKIILCIVLVGVEFDNIYIFLTYFLLFLKLSAVMDAITVEDAFLLTDVTVLLDGLDLPVPLVGHTEINHLGSVQTKF